MYYETIEPKSPEGPHGEPIPEQKLTDEEKAWQTANAANNLLREMGLFGNTTPKGDDPTWFPMKIMGEAQALIHTKNVRTGYERELGERLTPYKDMLKNVEMAYEIAAYLELRWGGRRTSVLPKYDDVKKYYGIETEERIEDAKMQQGKDVENNPHRAPVELNLAERKLLGILTQAREVWFDPERRTYSYTDLDNPGKDGEDLRRGIKEFQRKGGWKSMEEVMRQPKKSGGGTNDPK